MTIGIGAFGSQAGLAVFRALQAAEAVGRGAIGGFAVYAALSQHGTVYRYETQRGGSRTLFIDGEQTGVEPPEPVAQAIAAAVISSGPDRPVPLDQFLSADAKGGLVSGHRLPNSIGVDGQSLNSQVLNDLIEGKPAHIAVKTVLERNPQADAGLIAVDLAGHVYAQNSERVQRRPDLGHAFYEDGMSGARVSVLHNAIRPYSSLASLVAEIALDEMTASPTATGWITIPVGISVTTGDEDAIIVDENGIARQIVTTDSRFTHGEQIGAAIYLHSVIRQTDGQIFGKTLFEPMCTVKHGQLVDMSGQSTIRMNYQEDDR
ncbi:MAG: DUF6963 family protein [Elainellaceae cyanobacterium]